MKSIIQTEGKEKVKWNNSSKNMLLLTALFLLLFSCQSTKDKQTSKPEDFSINKEWSGDSLLKDTNWVFSIDSTCKIESYYDRSFDEIKADDKRCVFNMLTFRYKKLIENTSPIQIGKNQKITLKIEPKNIPREDWEDFRFQSYLNVYQNNNLVDSILIFNELQIIEEIDFEKCIYYIENNRIFLMNILFGKFGYQLKDYKVYEINPSTGMITLKSKI